MDCLVLAGGTPRPDDELFEFTRGRPKALLEVAGRSLVGRVLDTLAATPEIGRVVLVGLDRDTRLEYPRGLELVPGRGSWSENFFAGVERLLAAPGHSEHAAFCWSDIPLARPAMLQRFLALAAEETADVHAGLVPRRDLEDRFPEVVERYLHLHEGDHVAADFGVFRPARAARYRPQLEALAPRRKSVLAQARQVSMPLLVRYLLRRLSIPELERRLLDTYGIHARVHVVEDPELGLDVDGAVNLAICRRELGSGQRPTAS